MRGGAPGPGRRFYPDAGCHLGLWLRGGVAARPRHRATRLPLYEDPLRDEDIYGYVRLKQKLDIPIMATEAPAGGLDTYAIWITERATDYLRGDVPSKGGITNMVKTAHLAEAFGLRYEIHHSSNSLNNVANLHVAMAIRNCEFFEVLPPDGAHKYGLVNDITVDADGLVHAPMGPGLGAEIDFEMIKRRTEAVLR